MKIFPERFDHNPVLRLFGGAFIGLGIISVLLTGIAVFETFAPVQTTETTTIASVIQNGARDKSDAEVQFIEPAAGGNAGETVLILR